MKHILSIALLVIISSAGAYSQKVKYDDLFVLLKADNYADADGFLRIFLAKDPDEPHANYSMGKMLQTYMYGENLIKSSDRIVELADSSLLYYEKALQLNTEKYVEKKHDDDYFAEFRRRDLRTGKFAVKLSDVQLDIENRKKEIVKFKEDMAKLNWHLDASITFYDSSSISYSNIANGTATKILLYFTTGADELEGLRNIARNYDSSIYHLNTYLTIMKGMGKYAIDQKKVVSEIAIYPDDGISKTDFYGTSVELWNYSGWAKSMLDVIGKKIFPLKARMIAYDKKLSDLTQEVVDDTLDARSAIFRLATENVGRDLRDYDAKSLPAAIYNYRISEINYRSTINFWLKELQDTLDVGLKISSLNSLQKQLAGISKLTVILREANIEAQKKTYVDFLSSRYEGGIDNFINTQFEFVHADSVQLKGWFEEVMEQDRVTMWHEDSISLEIGHEYENENSIKFSTVLIDSLNERNLGFYAWSENEDELSLSFSISPSSRILDTLFSIPVSPELAKGEMANLHFLSDSLGVEKRIWVLNSSNGDHDAGFTLQVFTTDLVKGAGWDKEFKVKEIPKKLNFNHASHKISFLGEGDALLMILDEFGDEQDLPTDQG